MKNVRRSVLDNGLRLLYRKRDSEVVWMYITVETGSQYEAGFHKGIAHLMEHVILGPPKFGKTSRLDEYAAKHGLQSNAQTSRTTTEFSGACPKRYYKKLLALFAEKIMNPEFDEKFLKNEIKVVCKEIDMENDDTQAIAFDAQQKHLYVKEPFSNNTSGTKKDVRKITKEELLRFHSKYYVPANMHVVLNGICKGYKETVEASFGRYLPGKKPIRPVFKEKQVKKSLVLKKDLEQPVITIGCLLPPYPAKEAYAFDIIRWALVDKGITSRLMKEIREKRGLSYYAYFMVHDTYSNRITHFTSGAEMKDMKEISRIYFKELTKLREISDKELADAKRALKGIFILAFDDLENETNNIAFYEEIGNVKLFNEYQKRLENVTKEDVGRTIDDYLKSKYCKIIFK